MKPKRKIFWLLCGKEVKKQRGSWRIRWETDLVVPATYDMLIASKSFPMVTGTETGDGGGETLTKPSTRHSDNHLLSSLTTGGPNKEHGAAVKD